MYVPGLEVTAAHGKEVVVWVPVKGQDGGAKWLLDVLTHPPGHREVCRVNTWTVSHTPCTCTTVAHTHTHTHML